MKRALFLALLLINLGAFAWVRWYGEPPKPAALPTPLPDAKALQLMSELTPSEKKSLAAQATAAANAAQSAPAPATTAAPAAATSTAALACASYGPFPSADAAGSALTRLKLLGITGSQHLVPGKAKLGYWVYLPPFGNRKEADAATDLLKKKGVTDIYVVADEANRNAISLGVFSQKEGAVQRQKEIRRLGYKPQQAERFRDEPRYWIDAKGVEASLPAAESFKDLADEGAAVGKASTACSG
jgi:hypothetical protein